MLEAEIVMRPMRAAKLGEENLSALKFPLYLSPKLDGIRCVIKNGLPLTRMLKLLPNKRIRKLLSCAPEGLDGELIIGDPTAKGVFNRTQSVVMSGEGDITNFKFHVFDKWNQPDIFFDARHNGLKLVLDNLINHRGHDWLVHVEQQHVKSLDEFRFWEQHYVSQGYEGVMLRSPIANYKFGDSRLSDMALMKYKRWHDTEARVVGVRELRSNVAEPEIDERGYLVRPVRVETMIGQNVLGALVCEFPNGVKFDIGSGFNTADRAQLWSQKDDLIGKWVTLKYQEITKDGSPRFPIFKGFRDPIDFQCEQE
mgnify:CR=1 FL=1